MCFVAIDFETANETRRSACALGIVVVEDGQIVERNAWLLRPPEMRFNPFNISVHGIRPCDVEGQPTLCEVWETLLPYFSGHVLVAHNAPFDMSVLRSTLDAYGIEFPVFQHGCTRQIAKHVWPGLPTYNLKSVAQHLSITFRHHDAVEDADACAQIALRACQEFGAPSLTELLKRLASQPNQSKCRAGQPSESKKQPRSAISRPGDIRPSSTDFHPRDSFVERTFVFTGALVSMERGAAMQKVVNAGGKCSNAVTKATNYLVVGGLYSESFANGYQTGKLKRAISLIAAGADLEIISEDDFLRLLSD